MPTNSLFRTWVDTEVGSQANAARRLGLSKQYINFVYLGRVGVSKRLAELVEAASPHYSKAALLWGDNDNKQHSVSS